MLPKSLHVPDKHNGKGYLQGIKDIENIVLKTNAGIPLRLSDVARVELVPDERRGIIELNGEGESQAASSLTRSRAVRFLIDQSHIAIAVLGAVFLAVTGAEAHQALETTGR